MKLLIDHADVGTIRRLAAVYPIDGVTTNPGILAAGGQAPYPVLKAIRAAIGPDADLHVQTVARTTDGILADARHIAKILGRSHTYVKIPVTAEGLPAIRALSAEGYLITGTAVYTVQQAFLAGKAGAACVAPYVNRIDHAGGDGVATVLQIHDLFRANAVPTDVLAASFKNTRQVMALAAHGIASATLAPAVFDGLLTNPFVTGAVADFTAEFESVFGTGTTMAND